MEIMQVWCQFVLVVYGTPSKRSTPPVLGLRLPDEPESCLREIKPLRSSRMIFLPLPLMGEGRGEALPLYETISSTRTERVLILVATQAKLAARIGHHQ